MFQDVLQEYIPIIRQIARSTCYSSSAIDMADLCQVGEIAVLKAVKAYDPACGSNIKSFITRSIRREIYAEAARFLGVFTVDRRVTSLAAKINKLSKAGHSDQKIAVRLNKSEEYVRDLRLSYNKRSHVPILYDNILSTDSINEHDVRELLLNFNFNQIEMTILLNRILGHKSVKDIAHQLHIPQARVYALENIIKDRICHALGSTK